MFWIVFVLLLLSLIAVTTFYTASGFMPVLLFLALLSLLIELIRGGNAADGNR